LSFLRYSKIVPAFYLIAVSILLIAVVGRTLASIAGVGPFAHRQRRADRRLLNRRASS
jgi:hypothetical protein